MTVDHDKTAAAERGVKMKPQGFWGLLLIFAAVAALGFFWLRQRALTSGEPAPNGSLSALPAAGAAVEDQAGADVLRFSVATMWSVESTFFMYRDLVEHVAADVGRKDSFVLRSSYSELRQAIHADKVDVAFVCTGTYVEMSGRAEILVRPEFEDDIVYRSLLVVPRDSTVSTFAELAGKSVAFADPESFTGCVVPVVELMKQGHYPPEYLGEVLFSGNHERSIRAVDRGIAAAAAVHSIVWQSALEEDPALAERLKVVWSSQAYGVPPIVVPATLAPELKEKLKQEFLNLHKEPSGRRILSKLNIRRFVEPEPGDYDAALTVYNDLKSNDKVMAWLSRTGL